MFNLSLFPSSSVMGVGDVARALDVSIDTIRRWEKKGLIRGQRDARGQRIFNLDEVRLLKTKLFDKTSRGFQVLKAQTQSAYSVIELFAGAGGLALGFEHAGLNAKTLVEIEPRAAETLKTNRPHWDVRACDVANVSFMENEADIVTGGFPCQAFSYAGKKMGFEDTRGTLFFEYARIVNEVRPKLILAENVRGLVSHDEGRTLQTMLGVLDELGYAVQWRVVRAQYLDVAQKRERWVMIGVRKDLAITPIFPQERPYTLCLRDALENVPASGGQSYTERKHSIMAQIPEGGYWRDLPEPLQRDYMGASFFMGGGKTGMARRLAWDEPSLT
ncbi:MAG: DNA (cytosine-5-)-methyltransferase, partial [Halothiobacillus sp.]